MSSNSTKRATVVQVLLALKDKRIYENYAIHLFILVPVTILLAYLATLVDQHMGWQPFWGLYVRLAVAAPLFVLGAAIVIYTYSYLLLMGEGSPGSHLGGPRRLVTSGPYALVRHPSVIGKLFGVVALGLVCGSRTFLFFFVPILLAYSLITNRLIQERYCVKAFGKNYREYRRKVPMIFPRIRECIDFLRGQTGQADIEETDAKPGAIRRFELLIYLILLAALVILFTMVTIVIISSN